MERALAHLRHHLISYVALLVALTMAPASAYAVATIRSGDIVDGEVRAPDLGNNAVRSAKILDGTVQRADLAAGSVGGVQVDDDGLTGADVLEASLGQVPIATSALSGGTGRSGGNGTAKCDPESSTFVTCASLGLTLPAPGRVLIIANVRVKAEADANNGFGVCRVGSSVAGPVPESSAVVGATAGFGDAVAVVGVTTVLAAGPILVGLDCNQDSGIGAVFYDNVRITAVTLSAG